MASAKDGMNVLISEELRLFDVVGRPFDAFDIECSHSAVKARPGKLCMSLRTKKAQYHIAITGGSSA